MSKYGLHTTDEHGNVVYMCDGVDLFTKAILYAYKLMSNGDKRFNPACFFMYSDESVRERLEPEEYASWIDGRNDFMAIARIFGAVRAYEGKQFDVAAVGPAVLGVDQEKRDILAINLQREGKIDGLVITKDAEGQQMTVKWEDSKPEITLDGLEYIAESVPLRHAMRKIQNEAIAAARSAIVLGIQSML